MFCYCASLVEVGFVDVVNMSFLIVGHTHDNIDQNFSVLSNAIDEATYVMTPVAMMELIKTASTKTDDRPIEVLHLQYLHDWKDFFKDLYNRSFHYYNVPHRHRFIRGFGRAIYQYMHVSDPAKLNDEWLPDLPYGYGIEMLKNSLNPFPTEHCITERQCEMPRLAFIGSTEDLKKKLQIVGDVGEFHRDHLELALAYSQFEKKLFEVDNNLLLKQYSAQQQQAQGMTTPTLLTNEERDSYAKAIQKLFKTSSNKKVGLMLWLDFSKVSVAHLTQVRPRLLPALDSHNISDETTAAAQRIARSTMPRLSVILALVACLLVSDHPPF